MSTHTLMPMPNGDVRIFPKGNLTDWADFGSEEDAVAYLANINSTFGTNYTIEKEKENG